MAYRQDTPQAGKAILSTELREQFFAIATDNIGSVEPSVPAILVSDVRITTVDLTKYYEVVIIVDGVSRTVDMRSAAQSTSAVVADEIVAAINDAFAGSSVGGSIASTYNSLVIGGAVSSFVKVQSPTTGASSYVEVNRGAAVRDGLDRVFGVALRGDLPYRVTGTDLPEGSTWHYTDPSGGAIRVKVQEPARIVGSIDFTSSRDLSVNSRLRIRIVTDSATFGPTDIVVAGASPAATSGSEVVTAINNYFRTLPTWPNPSVGPASLVSREGLSGIFVQVVSGPSNNPSRGPGAQVVVSEFVGSPAAPLPDDALEDVFGIATGVGNAKYSRVPVSSVGKNWTLNYVRGIRSRTGAGIGPWGPAVEGKREIDATALAEGEVRTDLSTGIPWIGRRGRSGNVKRRLVPNLQFPAAYDRRREFIFVNSIPHNTLSTDVDAGTASGNVGSLLAGVDARSPFIDPSLYIAGRSGAHRTLHLPHPSRDSFDIALAVGSSSYGGKLPPTLTSGLWVVPAAFSGASNNRIWASTGLSEANYPGDQSGAGTLQWMATSRPSSYVVLLGSSTTTATQGFAGNLKYLIRGIESSGMNRGNLYVMVASRPAGGSAPTIYADAWLDPATGNFVSLSGLISGTYAEDGLPQPNKTVTVTVTSMPANYDVYVFAAPNTAAAKSLTVSTQIGKYAGANNYGNAAKAGVVYGLRPNSSYNSVYTGSGYQLTLDDQGNLELYERQNSDTPTLVERRVVDYALPYDSSSTRTGMTMRVVYVPDFTSNTASHYVYLDGSSNPADWRGEGEARTDTADLLSGGEEPPRVTRLVATFSNVSIHTFNRNSGYGGLSAGIAMQGQSTPVKSVYCKDVVSYFGSVDGASNGQLAGAPPVSGAAIRDIVGAVAVESAAGNKKTDGDYGHAAVLTDCSVGSPLTFRDPTDGTIEWSYRSGTPSDTRRVVIPKLKHLKPGPSVDTLFHRYLERGTFTGTSSYNAITEQSLVVGYSPDATQGILIPDSGTLSAPGRVLCTATFDGAAGMPSFQYNPQSFEYYVDVKIVGVSRTFASAGVYRDLVFRCIPVSFGGTQGNPAVMTFRLFVSPGYIYFTSVDITVVRKA